MTKFIAHNESGDIYGLGDTAEAAIADGKDYDGGDGLVAIACTDRLAEKVESIGWNSSNPGYSWHTVRGVADLIDEEDE